MVRATAHYFVFLITEYLRQSSIKFVATYYKAFRSDCVCTSFPVKREECIYIMRVLMTNSKVAWAFNMPKNAFEHHAIVDVHTAMHYTCKTMPTCIIPVVRPFRLYIYKNIITRNSFHFHPFNSITFQPSSTSKVRIKHFTLLTCGNETCPFLLFVSAQVLPPDHHLHPNQYCPQPQSLLQSD